MKTALNFPATRRFTPVEDYVEYEHASPSRNVFWSNMEDDVQHEWVLLTWVSRTASRRVSQLFASPHHGPISDRSRQGLMALVELIQNAHAFMRWFDIHADGSMEFELSGEPGEGVRVALGRNGTMRFLGGGRSTQEKASRFAKALIARLGSKEKGECASGTDAKKPTFAPPGFVVDDDDYVEWDVDFTPPKPPSRKLVVNVKHVGEAPIPSWSEGDE